MHCTGTPAPTLSDLIDLAVADARRLDRTSCIPDWAQDEQRRDHRPSAANPGRAAEA